MSCPPEIFVTISHLTKLRRVLSEDGILAINCSARDITCRETVIKRLGEVFGKSNILICGENITQQDQKDDSEDGGTVGGEVEDLNVVLFAVKRSTGAFVLPENTDLMGRVAGITSDGHLVSEFEECVCLMQKVGGDNSKKKTKKKKKKGKKMEGEEVDGEMAGCD